MATVQDLNNLRSLSPNEQLFVMAITVVAERIRRLSEDDLTDLWTLVKEYGQTKDPADQQGTLQTMLEIIDGDDAELVEMPLSDADPANSDLAKWRDWVGVRVRTARAEANLTQDELAERSGLPQSHISRIENGKLSPSRATIEKIAEALAKPLTDFDCNA